jgi:hypothetical protein
VTTTSDAERIFLISYELRPADGAAAEGIGGAFANAWVRAPSLAEARARAEQHLRASGWTILATMKELTVDPQRVPEPSRPYLQQAQADGEVFEIHAFPPQPADA